MNKGREFYFLKKNTTQVGVGSCMIFFLHVLTSSVGASFFARSFSPVVCCVCGCLVKNESPHQAGGDRETESLSDLNGKQEEEEDEE